MGSLTGVSVMARDLLRLFVSRAHDPKRNPLRRARSNSGHLPQLRNQIPDRCRVLGLSQSKRGFATANPSFGGFNPVGFPSSAEQAAPAGANRIAMDDLPPHPNPAPSETRHMLLPNVFLDTERLHSRTNPDAR